MVIWQYSYIILSIVLLAFLIWKEVKRPLQLRLWWRLIASTITVICLACLATDITYKKKQSLNTFKRKLVMLTDGYSKDSLARFYTQHQQLVDTILLSNLSENKLQNFNVVNVMGNGFDEADLQLLNNYPITFHPSKKPTGIVFINWQQTLTIGENFVVQGTYNNDTKTLSTIYLNAFGNNVDSVSIKPFTQQLFQLQTVPKYNNKGVYSIFVVANKDTLENNPLPFQVQPTIPLKILLLASSPNFENKFLKNWLYENNYAVATRTSVTKGKYEQSFSNIKTISLNNLSATALQQFDVVIADATELSVIAKNELAVIKNQIVQNGLGLIVRVDSNNNNTPFYLKPFPFTPTINQEKKIIQINYGNNTTAIQIDEIHYIKPQPNTQVLVKNSTQNSLASLSLFGTGKIVATTLNNTYTLQLQNKQNYYTQLWTMLLKKATKKASPEDIWSIHPNMSYINQKTALSLETSAEIAFGIVGSTKIYLQQNELLPFKWSGTYWPNKAGWHTIISANNTTYNWYVFNNTHWQNVAATQKINTTKRYAMQHPITTTNTTKLSQSITIIIPKIVFFLFFLLAACYLWLERKL
ncbi:MAG: hypothetical protein H7101_02585 [Deinococcales bacterium]|nr:hypothetical protein [Chitinophagaceae bacterium]